MLSICTILHLPSYPQFLLRRRHTKAVYYANLPSICCQKWSAGGHKLSCWVALLR